MPYFETNPEEIEVDVYDFISACSSSEIKGLIECLIDEGHLPSSITPSTNPSGTLASNEFDASVCKLFGNHWRLTNEDTDVIMKIADKL
jgi:hypothetical protein